MLVGVKNWANVRALKVARIQFEVILGLKVSFNKSLLVGVNVNDSWLTEAVVILNCKTGWFSFLYLGLPIRVTLVNCTFCIPCSGANAYVMMG